MTECCHDWHKVWANRLYSVCYKCAAVKRNEDGAIIIDSKTGKRNTEEARRKWLHR